jgi:pimeloyl-ACP methyl ester carboxylesterase
MAIEIQNGIYSGALGKKHTYDLTIPERFNGRMILFMHGFMGFKDWGCWGLMMDYFISRGFGFCRFNITHNGTTPEFPTQFVDLESFGNDTYKRELDDLLALVKVCRKELEDKDRLLLMGHSRGGGVALLSANMRGVDGVVSLAGISSIENRFPVGEALEKWRLSGVRYVHNSRTQQDLPQYFVQYEEFIENRQRLDIRKACQEIKIPVLLIHGDRDASVDLAEGKLLSAWTGQELQVIHGAEHTFGAVHPCTGGELPEALREACALVEKFALELD